MTKDRRRNPRHEQVNSCSFKKRAVGAYLEERQASELLEKHGESELLQCLISLVVCAIGDRCTDRVKSFRSISRAIADGAVGTQTTFVGDHP